jgi:glutamate carboxypeptidase
MADLLEELVAIESPTSDPDAVNRMGERVAEKLDMIGAALTVHPRTEVGDIIEARWNADKPGKPLLIVCHMDTVHPVGELGRNPVRRENGRLYGPGSYDMKGSIVTAMEAVRGLRDLDALPDRPLIMLMTSDEETGSAYSRELIQTIAKESALAMIMEPALPDGSVKTSRKSVGGFTVKAFGVASHAGGAHEQGVNAIEELAHQVIALQKMTDYQRGTTVSVGFVEGGTARNTVPDRATVEIDTRAVTTAEMERLTRQIYDLKPVLKGARLEISGGFDRPPMERDDTMIRAFTQAQQIAAKHGLTIREASAGGASDGNYTAATGTPTLDGLGPQGDGAHSEHEFILTASLATSALLIASLVMEWE